MGQAYDLAALVLQLKGRGLDLAEESVKLVIEELFAWLEQSASMSATPYDDLLLVIYPQLKQLALAAADKIDGAVG